MRIGAPAIAALALVLTVGSAVGEPNERDFTVERSLFLLAERALTQGDDRAFQATRTALGGYPLLPYLEYRRLARNLGSADPGAVADFLERHGDTPLARMLRNGYLNHLAQEGQWHDFLRFAGDTDGLSTELTCFRKQALLNAGQRQEALVEVDAIWLHGHSQPKACDPVLDAWRADGRLTPELAWQRLELAVEAGQTGLARYLRRYLRADDRAWADRWLELEANPERVTRAGFRAGDHLAAGRMLERALLRLVPRDLDGALAAWQSHGDRLGLDTESQYRILHALALRLALRGRPETLPFMAGLPDAVFDDQLRQWQLRSALRDRDWNTVLAAVDAMSAEAASEARWQYWRARALEQLGRDDEAIRSYRAAAQERNFHGFLAADRLGVPYRIGHEPTAVATSAVQRVAQDPAIQRMRELVLLDRYPEARREWSHRIDALPSGDQEAAARLFADWGWHDRAIFTAARARSWGDIDLRFPLAFADLILAGAREQEIDPAWAMAIARQESAFLHDVRSGAGALGIMQVMPATGRSVADAAGVRIRNDHDILNPSNNARLGTYYLRRNLDSFGGHSLLSTAAYNAGAHRVRSWLPEQERMDPDIWAELIPFHETRDYIQRVFAYRIIYAVRLGMTPPSLQTLLFPVTPREQLALARERHLADHGITGPTLAATRDFCDAPGYTSARCP
ncbi:Soluble lytic murein transglycosylase precursor [Thioalkalivibrio nitratireducens DSM 14787]|uniref:Soluble lytic murein transglycosylase n=1 Tax=Thioalkalivibrio nitratireducens (strain DSM 14787 / UNIQEM 213 / ALEN2) TaxID=1255043 RepID=L0DUC0_THIND|nr:transglycosylase SLT domain-containing protein [Thioalkalivibrio nitratireducens]AGA31931.1 Soluble lytic murein transglycosylase precursor [Thioalkalivibrio nitratireducens DSM 14787]